MRQIIFATTNKDKVREIKEILSGLDVELIPMQEIGFEGEIEENGTTFEENAAIKAEAVAAFVKEHKPEYADAIVMADDSGLEIDAMGKMPGVLSHRWLGERTYTEAMTDIIREMKDVPEQERTARFVCSIAAVVPGHKTYTLRRTIEGTVAHEIRGEGGFGYDPFFYVPEYGCTTAEMTSEQKNAISHRGKGLRAMRDLLLFESLL